MRFALNHVVFIMVIAAGGCEKQKEPARPSSAAVPKADSTDQPAAAPASADLSTAAAMNGRTLALTGLTMTVPNGWEREAVEPGPLAAKAAFRLPKAEGDARDGSVRITHYPNMKGMPGMAEMNINRWVGQVSQADGNPYPRDQVKPQVTEKGRVRLTAVDLTGRVNPGMMGGGQSLPDHRMIAAIIDHPQGPHFVKVLGGSATIERWGSAINDFLHNATVP